MLTGQRSGWEGCATGRAFLGVSSRSHHCRKSEELGQKPLHAFQLHLSIMGKESVRKTTYCVILSLKSLQITYSV